MIIQFATQSYKSDSAQFSSQRLVNLYSEKAPEGAKAPVAVFGSPGLTAFATLGIGPVRGVHVMNSVLYAVSGPTLYSVSATGMVTPLGSAVGGTGNVVMSDNGTQLLITNGVNGYVWTAVGGFVVITDAAFNAANTVTFFDNVFVFDWLGTNKVFISNSLDGTSYNGLAFSVAEVSSAFVLATVNQTETLLVFTGDHIETWYDAGAPIFPFLRVDGATIERGCAAGKSPVKEDNAVFFLGDDLVFYRLQGVQPMRVSNHAAESAFRGYASCSDLFTFSYTFEGHKFIALTFPGANASWHYDISTGEWHERESWDQNNNSYGRWRGNCHATCYGLELVGDAFSGQIGFLDKTAYTEFGSTIRGLAVSAPLHSDRKRLTISRMELDFQTGVGVATGQGSNPQVMLEWSKDGSETYSAIKVWQSIGRIGAFLTRLRWLRLGQARQWVFRYTITDPVRRTMIAANADVASG